MSTAQASGPLANPNITVNTYGCSGKALEIKTWKHTFNEEIIINNTHTDRHNN